MRRLNPPVLALLILAFVVFVFTITAAVMLIRQIPAPEWFKAVFAPMVTLLVGIVTPAPKGDDK